MSDLAGTWAAGDAGFAVAGFRFAQPACSSMAPKDMSSIVLSPVFIKSTNRHFVYTKPGKCPDGKCAFGPGGGPPAVPACSLANVGSDSRKMILRRGKFLIESPE